MAQGGRMAGDMKALVRNKSLSMEAAIWSAGYMKLKYGISMKSQERAVEMDLQRTFMWCNNKR